MMPRYFDIHRVGGGMVMLLAVVVAAACASLQPEERLAAFSTQLTGMNELPPVQTFAGGRMDAVLDRNTNLLRWKLSYSGLSGPATAGHFHGPGGIDTNAGVTLALGGPLRSPMEGRATLTAAQAAELLAGQWYVNLHTAAHPGGEIRGQMILRM